MKKSLPYAICLIVLAYSPASAQFGGGVDPTDCTVWGFTTPLEDTVFDNDSAVSASGDAPDPNLDWQCKITQTVTGAGLTYTRTAKVSSTTGGSPCGGSWSGTVPLPVEGAWYPLQGTSVRPATMDLIHDGNIVASQTIKFEYGGS
jgi:hypothetical protein